MAIESETRTQPTAVGAPDGAMRAEFEAWYIEEFGAKHRFEQKSGGVYVSGTVEMLWRTWQAAWSRASSAETKDAARYRWLRAEAARPKRDDPHDRLHVSINYPTRLADGSGYTGLLVTPLGVDFDARVDAAIAQQEAGRAQA